MTMGRKPSQLILDHFTRGAKLKDSSNRYQHSCKACGEQFPKGRIDSLTTHLTKKCPALSLRQRTEIVYQLHDLGDFPDRQPSGTAKEEGKKPTSRPFSPSKQNFDGLNVLAEASRRVGENDRPEGTAEHLDGHNLPVDPQLEVDALSQAFLNTSDDGLGDRTNSMRLHRR